MILNLFLLVMDKENFIKENVYLKDHQLQISMNLYVII